MFGELPQVHTASEIPKQRDTLGERAAMAHAARTEMQRIMARMRVACGLKHAVPRAADESYDPGDQVLVWRERVVNHRIGEWIGPSPCLA